MNESVPPSPRPPVPRRYERYVAIGDSSTEGLDDPDGNGSYRGWANRLAETIAAHQGSLLYANLGIRGRTTRQIRDTQLGPAMSMDPDLVTLFTGTNDVIRPKFNAAALGREVEFMQRALIAGGATVLGFTLPDLSDVLPMARPIAGRVAALNDALRAASEASGAVLVDFARHAVSTDLRLWSEDRLHANAEGHARIAAALAWALGLPGTDESWADPLPAAPRRSLGAKVVAEVRWSQKFLVPWAWRHLHGRSSGDGKTPKRPTLEPLSSPPIDRQ